LRLVCVSGVASQYKLVLAAGVILIVPHVLIVGHGESKNFRGLTTNISPNRFIVLVGLACKNAILIRVVCPQDRSGREDRGASKLPGGVCGPS